MHAIEIAHLSKRFGTFVAVDDLSLAVPAGSVFGFLGPNGAGKSTTIGCLTGVLDRSAGEIRLLGEQMHAGAATIKRRIGVMPETLALFDALSAPEFLQFQGEMFGLDADTTRQRAQELLAALDLAAEGRKRLADFSAGMRKRVAFAAAIIHTPAVLFLDEPFESIDPAGVAMLKSWLRRIAGQGRTIFITSHVLETVERLCDRAAIIAKPGRLLWEGDLVPLAAGGRLSMDDRKFASLEALYLYACGPRSTTLSWV